MRGIVPDSDAELKVKVRELIYELARSNEVFDAHFIIERLSVKPEDSSMVGSLLLSATKARLIERVNTRISKRTLTPEEWKEGKRAKSSRTPYYKGLLGEVRNDG